VIDVVPGVTVFPSPLFQGSPTFAPLNITNGTQPTSEKTIRAGSMIISAKSYAVFGGSGSPLIIWDSISDFSQIPDNALSLRDNAANLLEVQSSK